MTTDNQHDALKFVALCKLKEADIKTDTEAFENFWKKFSYNLSVYLINSAAGEKERIREQYERLLKTRNEEIADLRIMLDKERKQRAENGANQRVQKLEYTVAFLFGLFISHILSRLFCNLLMG